MGLGIFKKFLNRLLSENIEDDLKRVEIGQIVYGPVRFLYRFHARTEP